METKMHKGAVVPHQAIHPNISTYDELLARKQRHQLEFVNLLGARNSFKSRKIKVNQSITSKQLILLIIFPVPLIGGAWKHAYHEDKTENKQ